MYDFGVPLGSLLNSVEIMCKVHEQFVQRKKLFVQMTKKFLMRIWSGGRGWLNVPSWSSSATIRRGKILGLL